MRSASSLLALASSSTSSSSSSSSAGVAFHVVERSVQCSDGLRLAARRWSSPSLPPSPTDDPSPPRRRRRLLLLHGWLDNAASFRLLAPALVTSPRRASDAVGLDFPGHGLSDHKSPDGPTPSMTEFAHYAREAMLDPTLFDDDENGHVYDDKDDKWTLVGHSMGAAVALMVAAAWPESVERLVLLEGLGPMTRNAEDLAKTLRAGSDARREGNRRLYAATTTTTTSDDDRRTATRAKAGSSRGNRIYPSFDAAARARVASARLYPGDQSVSVEAARALVERASRPASDDGTVVFRHDPRLHWPYLQYLTAEQGLGLLAAVRCPTCVVLAEKGWPIPAARRRASLDTLNPVAYKRVPGSHHCHADPEDAGAVAAFVEDFLSNDRLDADANA